MMDPEKKRVLLMINPIGGQGKAMRIYKKKVLPMLVDSNIGHVLFITKRANDARDLLKNTDTNLKLWRSIVVLSGDGLFHEIINGLMSRSDWKEAMMTPLGIIPAGSGNGLAHSLINHDYPDISNKDYITLSTANIIQGRTSDADLVRVCSNSDVYWSFLSFGWGLLADIDIESEMFRMLGELRFTLWSILRAICLKTYRGKLSYQLLEDDQTNVDNNINTISNDNSHESNIPTNNPKPSSLVELEDDFVCVYAAYQTHLSSDVKMVPNARLSDGNIALLYLRGNLSSLQIINFLTSIKTGSHVNLPYVTAVKVKSFTLEPLVKSRITVDGELIPWDGGPIFVEVKPKLAKFICKRNNDM